MVVCKYFLEGACRFGDRCKFEHPGPRPFSSFGGGSSGFSNPTDRPSSKNVCQYFLQGNCRFGNNCKFSHPTGGSGQNVFGSKPSFGGQSAFGQTRTSSGFGASNKNIFNRNQNRFGVLSNEGAMGGQNNVFGGSNQQQSSTEAMLQNPTQVTQIQQIVRRDMEAWESSKQWPLSCYTYLKEEPCLPGLVDFSPEEIRKEAYDAKANNKAAAYEQGLKSLIEKSKQRRLQLKNINMHQLQSEIRSSMTKSSSDSTMSFQSASQSGSLFTGSTSLNQSGGLFSNSTSTGLGGTGLGSLTMQQTFGSTPTTSVEMGSAPESSGMSGMSLSTSLFSPGNQGLPSNTGLFVTTGTTSGVSSNTLFRTANTTSNVNQFGTSTTVSQPGMAPKTIFGSPSTPSTTQTPPTVSTPAQSTSSLTCSEEDIAAFKSDKFVLGKIPECPPPPELCK